MRTIQLTTRLPNAEADALAATFVDRSHYDVLVSGESATVLKPNGDILLVYLKDVIPRAQCAVAYSVFKTVDVVGGGNNRGLAAGNIDPTNPNMRDYLIDRGAEINGTRSRPVKADGTLSATSYATDVNSGIVGYFDRYPRIPYCRLTAFNLDHYQEFEAARPYAVTVSKLFEEYCPARYALQEDIVAHTAKDFVIHDTVFTTITVNRNWQTAVHKDVGDFKDGFGVMSVLEGGKYHGCELVFPQYRCAVDMRTGGLCLADVHEWHGNTPLERQRGHALRISLVFYYREKMFECGSAEQERARALRWQEDFQTRKLNEDASLY